jgi:hypothetical protein
MTAAEFILETGVAPLGGGAFVVANGFGRSEFDLRSLARIVIDQRNMTQAATVFPNLGLQ